LFRQAMQYTKTCSKQYIWEKEVPTFVFLVSF
jgi:hypothetical protein